MSLSIAYREDVLVLGFAAQLNQQIKSIIAAKRKEPGKKSRFLLPSQDTIRDVDVVGAGVPVLVENVDIGIVQRLPQGCPRAFFIQVQPQYRVTGGIAFKHRLRLTRNLLRDHRLGMFGNTGCDIRTQFAEHRPFCALQVGAG